MSIVSRERTSTGLATGAWIVQPPPPGGIGARVHGLDPRRVDATQAARLLELVYEHKLVVFEKVPLPPSDYIAFARCFGEPQIYFQPNYHHPDHPEIFVSSNVPENGRKVGVAGTGRYWHTDYQFFDDPLPLTMLQPIRLPRTRRETSYIDMQRMWRELPADLRAALVDRKAVHEAKWRYKIQATDIDKSITEILEEFGRETPPVRHPTVLRHPVNARELLYVSEGFTVGLDGVGYEQGKDQLAQVFRFCHQPEHVHVHTWCEGDILLWDNRQLMHRAGDTPKGEQSTSWRIGIYDGLPFYTNRPDGARPAAPPVLPGHGNPTAC
ncbi:MAG: TauD/TfdA family dioxygenase [Planctomycetes bacterium]|nr:TauD/TfdA family dioxygenase [Planctomycetota bacterium]